MALLNGAVLRLLGPAQCAGDPGWTHERVLRWPSGAEESSWMARAPGNRLYSERMSDFSSIVTWMEGKGYPAGTRDAAAFSKRF